MKKQKKSMKIRMSESDFEKINQKYMRVTENRSRNSVLLDVLKSGKVIVKTPNINYNECRIYFGRATNNMNQIARVLNQRVEREKLDDETVMQVLKELVKIRTTMVELLKKGEGY